MVFGMVPFMDSFFKSYVNIIATFSTESACKLCITRWLISVYIWFWLVLRDWIEKVPSLLSAYTMSEPFTFTKYKRLSCYHFCEPICNNFHHYKLGHLSLWEIRSTFSANRGSYYISGQIYYKFVHSNRWRVI